MRSKYMIVDLCPMNHPEARKIVKANIDLGLQVYDLNESFVVILNDYPNVWKDDDVSFRRLPDGLYTFDVDGVPIYRHR